LNASAATRAASLAQEKSSAEKHREIAA